MSATAANLDATATETPTSGFGAAMCSLVSGMCGVTGPLVAGAQQRWAATSVGARLRILRAARHSIAADAESFAAAISPQLARTQATTLVAEVLPLLDACKFLEREAKRLLAPRQLGGEGRPFWLGGVLAEIYREPVGHILIIGPANFPLFLPGVQALQALAAGNAVTWKPGAGGEAVAQLMQRHLLSAGLPEGLFAVTDESVEAAKAALADRPGKVIFTGSSASGQRVLATLAETATPAVVELSGADAILVMPSADLQQVAKAVAFGLRLNGASVCMSPRRLFARPSTMTKLRPLLDAELAKIPAVALDRATAAKLEGLLADAVAAGAVVHGEYTPATQRPLLVTRAKASMAIAQSDIFAPVLSLLEAESMLHVLEQYAQCPYALTASIFCGRGDEKKARSMASLLQAGTVLINDLIAPTSDPRVPFGGRAASGFGVTRGGEGLLEMTAIKTVLVRRGGRARHLEPAGENDAKTFTSLIAVVHGGGLGARLSALTRLLTASRR